MDCITQRIPYHETGYFSKIVLDYLGQEAPLRPFYLHTPDLDGIRSSLEARRRYPTNRQLLADELSDQYRGLETHPAVRKQIESLRSPNTFTVTTAHQPNLFTGPLYFIYKILHTIRLAAYLEQALPGHHFVPVYYMGSEDADLDELGHINLEGERLTWHTSQTGAVGRMRVDKELLALISRMEGQLGGLPHGPEVLGMIRAAYREGIAIQDATFHLVHALFGAYGLVVLIPDRASLKRVMIPVFEQDLLEQQPSSLVHATSGRLGQAYKVQAHPREINLFYLEGGIRQRIEADRGEYRVVNSDLRFSREDLVALLQSHPERFSPNVILRGLFQETILPNVAFIGGGGELAYWLELKDLFAHYEVPYPVLLLRNSFLIVPQVWRIRMDKLGLDPVAFFQPETDLLNQLVRRNSAEAVALDNPLREAGDFYAHLKEKAASVDPTLGQHVEALRARALHQLRELEKKLLRAERRRYSDQQRQIRAIREHLFPGKSLQERTENFASFYGRWGRELIECLYEKADPLGQEFIILEETGAGV
ncbi:MAG TPA: bacillithiol biosynthesis cysteine-adding enzyme BshC [Chitinophagaceae bacterium]|nr:bacillithiol biosynthesis cysteine-adding enzyme BshC [Chitinophagaceae bacterium]